MQLPPPNYDEAAVPSYQLPELLRSQGGSTITSAEAWQNLRRPELLELFRRHVYGRFEASVELSVERVVDQAPLASGIATRTELDVVLHGRLGQSLKVRVLLFVPSTGRPPFPTFVGLNRFGNQTVHPEPAIRLSEGWLPNDADLGLTDHRATEASRGVHAGGFPVEMLAAHGFALATAYAGDLDPDFDDGFENGVHALLSPNRKSATDAAGSIAAWAWGLSRIREALQSVPRIDPARVAVFGHSRLGKAALWAAAEDPHFALAISNDSGHGGAALSRRRFGERVLHLNRRFPHWFCRGFHHYNEREHELPVDQHQLLALLAPRPLYVASAANDLWADPRGERLACEAASPCYDLFGLKGLVSDDAQGGSIGYHLRPGRHDITPLDFWHFVRFATHHLVPTAKRSS